jgi:hypothetical protein
MDDQHLSPGSLIELKRQIDEEIRPLIGHLKTPLDRYNAYMALLRDNWSEELAGLAFREAKQIENPEDKFHSLQGLSSEIYFRVQDLNELQPTQV